MDAHIAALPEGKMAAMKAIWGMHSERCESAEAAASLFRQVFNADDVARLLAPI